MGVSSLGAHVCNLQYVAPSFGISLFIAHAIALDGPFSRALPLHHASALVRPEDDDELASTAEMGIAAVSDQDVCRLVVSTVSAHWGDLMCRLTCLRQDQRRERHNGQYYEQKFEPAQKISGKCFYS